MKPRNIPALPSDQELLSKTFEDDTDLRIIFRMFGLYQVSKYEIDEAFLRVVTETNPQTHISQEGLEKLKRIVEQVATSKDRIKTSQRLIYETVRDADPKKRGFYGDIVVPAYLNEDGPSSTEYITAELSAVVRERTKERLQPKLDALKMAADKGDTNAIREILQSEGIDLSAKSPVQTSFIDYLNLPDNSILDEATRNLPSIEQMLKMEFDSDESFLKKLEEWGVPPNIVKRNFNVFLLSPADVGHRRLTLTASSTHGQKIRFTEKGIKQLKLFLSSR